MANTKRALLTSALAIVACVAMLIGSTFAWFTDTASTGVNKIQAGNLKIELQMKDANNNWVNAEGKTLPFLVKGEIPAEGTQILWEPGCTYYVPAVRVLNKGNLAVRFEYVNELLGVTGKLAEVLEPVFKILDADGNLVDIPDDNTDPFGELDILKPGEASPAWSFGYHMNKNAGNEYQNAAATGMCLTVVATQATYEKDSIDDQYDKDAEYDPEPITAEELRKIFVDETTGRLKQEVKLDKNYLLTDAWTPLNSWTDNGPATGTATIDGQGHTIYNMTVNGDKSLGFIGANSADLTIKNLTFSNATVVGTGSFLGVVIGYQYGEVTLENVKVENSIVMSTNERGIRIGGLVGFSVLHDGAKLHLKDCTVNNSDFEGYHNTCGLVGTLIKYSEKPENYSISGCTVSDCTFLWGSKNPTYNNFAVSEGGPYNARYDEIIGGVTATNNSFEYKE